MLIEVSGVNSFCVIALEEDVISYFKTLADETGIPYQTLINLYLQDCAKSHRKPSLEWASGEFRIVN
jgi:hypothetical protein